MASTPEPPEGGCRSPITTWVDTAVLSVAALTVAGVGLSEPSSLVFDEVYYVSDALSLLDVGVAQGFQAHPPLGSWLLAGGIAILGDTPVGWRVAPLLLGVIAVALLHRLALRLLPTGPTARATAAAVCLLLVVDGSWFLLSRTAMLDGPLTTLVLAATVAAAAHAAKPMRWISVPLLLAGAAAGAATAVKLSGAASLVLAPIVIATLAVGSTDDRRRTVLRALPVLFVVAGVVYSTAWIPFMARRGDIPVVSCPAEASPCAEVGGLDGVIAQHAMFVRYHTSFTSPSDQTSPPDLWPALVRPVGFWRADCVTDGPTTDVLEAGTDCSGVPWSDEVETIRYTGNPVTWLSFLALLPILVAGARRGDPLARIALAGWGLQWLPWLLATRTSFLFYMAPTVPFIALGTVAAVRLAVRTSPTRPLLAGVGGSMTGFTVGLLTAVPAATAIVGAALGGWLSSRGRVETPRPAPTAQAIAVTALVGAAVVAFVILRPVLTAG